MTPPHDDAPSIPAETWREVREQLVSFVHRRVSDRETAEDITQTVLERLARAEPAGIDNPRAWLYRAARNAIIDHYRVRRVNAPLDGLDPVSELSADIDVNDPAQELAACLRPLVDELPEPYRRAVTLVDLEGRTHAAAARFEHLSVSGMKSRVQRGRTKLAALLTACCDVTLNADRSIDNFEASADCDCSAPS